VIFRQLIDLDTKTLTYLIGDPWSRKAVLIDPVRDQVARDVQLLDELGLELTYALDTHVHADHVTGAGALRAKTGCKVVSAAASVDTADITVSDGDAIQFGLQVLEVRATPGHTAECVSYVSATTPMVFTGDALFIRGCGRTDFQGGDARTLYRSVRDKLFSLRDETAVCPGHDYKGRTVSTIREERLYNARLGGGRTEDQFVAIMAALDLAYPRKMDVAVPANMQSGCTAGDRDTTPPVVPPDAWPMYRTPTGAPNVPAIWVADQGPSVRVVDVRTVEEWTGPDGRIEHGELVPMDHLIEASGGWSKTDRVVLVCRSGGRSDRVAKELESRGFRAVASMTGGMLQWRALGLPLYSGDQG
jgi:sulfur dioxygenase